MNTEPLDRTLVWLDARIEEHEALLRRPLEGGMASGQAARQRNDYAGWLAERDYLRKVRAWAAARRRVFEPAGGKDG